MENTQLIEKVRKTAEGYFERGELFCSEAVVKTINDLLDKPYDESVTKLASGFSAGIGQSGCLCGAVSGGVMALGMAYGRKHGESMSPNMFPAVADLHDHIKKMYKSTCCRVLTKDFKESGSEEHIAHCVKITGEVAAYVAKKLLENEIKLNIQI